MADRITRSQDIDGPPDVQPIALPADASEEEILESSSSPTPTPDIAQLSPLTPGLLNRMRRVDPTLIKRYHQKSGE